jgi:hypothetical protein
MAGEVSEELWEGVSMKSHQSGLLVFSLVFVASGVNVQTSRPSRRG